VILGATASAAIERHLASEERVRMLAQAAAMDAGGGSVEVAVNTADGDTADSIYLTVTGLSAEIADDGQVGRGNRVNGLITPCRPMSLEAAAGKDSVTHTATDLRALSRLPRARRLLCRRRLRS